MHSNVRPTVCWLVPFEGRGRLIWGTGSPGSSIHWIAVRVMGVESATAGTSCFLMQEPPNCGKEGERKRGLQMS